MRKVFSGLQNVARKMAITTSTAGLVLGTALPAMAVPTDVSLELGDARVGETSTYTLDLSTLDTGTVIECFEVDLDTAADGSGSNPTGLDTSSSTLDSNTLGLTGFTVDNAVSGTLRASNGTGVTPNAAGEVVWGNVDNGTTANTTYYAVVSTYTDDTCSTLNETVSVAFVYTNGQLVEVTVDPSLTFSIDAVAASDATGDATTTVTTTDGTVPFGNATSASNEVAAHDINVDTNAASGYSVYVRDTQDLTNTTNATATIDNHTGTNATPTALAGTGEEFGYHTDGMVQFGAGEYAAFTQTNEPVLESTTATSSTETARVTYQVGIDTATDAGTYQTTLIYTMVPTY